MGQRRFDPFTLLMTILGAFAGWGITAAWIWDTAWAAVITAAVVTSVAGVYLFLRSRQKKEDYHQRSTKQLLVAFEHLFRVISDSLGFLHRSHPEWTATPPHFLTKGPITQESIVEFAAQVSGYLINIAQRLGETGCINSETCMHRKAAQESRQSLETVLLTSQTFGELLGSLVDVIVDNTNNISAPLSSEILVVKKEVSNFVRDLDLWRQNSQRQSTEELKRAMGQFEVHSNKLSAITRQIQDSRQEFRKNLDHVIQHFVRISERTDGIHEISERVKMLSLNAAIEAARAGEFGRGFKIIAGEVQKLSVEVQSLVKGITTEISSMNQTLTELVHRFDKESQVMAGSLTSFNKELNAYEIDLEDYRKAFGGIIQTITGVSVDLQNHLDNLAPIFQLQDMTVQQVGHLSVIMSKIQDRQAPLAGDAPTVPEARRKEIHQSVLSLAEVVATTDDELHVVRRLYERHQLPVGPAPVPTAESKSNIELF